MKEEVIRTVRETRIIAIIRGFSPDECLRLAEAYREGGIRMVEVTFNQRDRSDWANTAAAIRMIGERFPGEVFAGAGTVLTAEQLKIAADAGAGYIITPSLDVEIVRAAVDAGLVAMPGAFTPTEIAQAYAAGASFVKVFPAVSLGPAYIKAIRAMGDNGAYGAGETVYIEVEFSGPIDIDRFSGSVLFPIVRGQ